MPIFLRLYLCPTDTIAQARWPRRERISAEYDEQQSDAPIAAANGDGTVDDTFEDIVADFEKGIAATA